MSEAPKVIWACPDVDDGWRWPVASKLSFLDGRVRCEEKYHHDETVTALEAKVARLEAALDAYKSSTISGNLKTFCGMPIEDAVKIVLSARKALEEAQ